MDSRVNEWISKIRNRLQNLVRDVTHRVRTMSRREAIFLLAFILVLSYAGAVLPSKFTVALSESVDHRIFCNQPLDLASVKRGAYVTFDLYTRLKQECWPCRVLKQVACVGGDFLHVTEKGSYYCNGEYLGKSKSHAKDGTPLQAFKFSGLVPESKIFVAGNSKDSYDSRYIGFVSTTDIKGIVKPLL